jgi:hypothetical protein
VPDIFAAQIVLDQPGIRAGVRQHVASGVPQHVRVGRDVELGGFASGFDDILRAVHRQRAATLRDEYVGAGAALFELPEVT